MSRKKIIAGNWKMNMTPSEAVKLVETLKPLVANDDVDVVFCVPAIDILPVVEAAKGSNIQVGAENMYFEEKGAFTGEISPNMLTDAGVKYVVLGHSERREYFAETSETVNKKMLKAFEHGITPVSYTHLDVYKRQIHVGKDNSASQITSEAKEFKRHNSELRNSLNAILKTISVITVSYTHLSICHYGIRCIRWSTGNLWESGAIMEFFHRK